MSVAWEHRRESDRWPKGVGWLIAGAMSGGVWYLAPRLAVLGLRALGVSLSALP